MALDIKENSIGTLTFSNIITMIGFSIWRIMFNNFAVELFDATATEIGIIQAVR